MCLELFLFIFFYSYLYGIPRNKETSIFIYIYIYIYTHTHTYIGPNIEILTAKIISVTRFLDHFHFFIYFYWFGQEEWTIFPLNPSIHSLEP
jgi:hypothetical protein